MMRHATRLTALLVSLLFAHLMWIGSGFACVMPGTGHSEGAAMAGMSMPGMDVADTDVPSTAQHAPDGAPQHDHAPCKFPWAPDGCQSMTPCAPLALTSHTQSLRALDAIPSSVASLLVLAPPSQVRAPELPPPKA